MAKPFRWVYCLSVRKFGLIFLLCLASSMTGTAETWKEVQQSPDFLAAKKHIADYLPDLAIPKIQKLLTRPKIDGTARMSLLTLLGESQVRAGTPGDALKTLDNKLLREFSPSHLWRSYALVQFGRYRDAIGELEKIDRRTMRENADLQTGKLQIALGDLEEASKKLTPLLESKNPSILKEATLQLISLSLSQKRLEEVSQYIEQFNPSTPVEESLARYLEGRLHLAKGERILAVGAFQTLLDPEFRKNLPAALFHESTIALADSLALDGNEAAAVNSLIETLKDYPGSPKIEEMFNRLRAWSEKIDTTSLEKELENWVPAQPKPQGANPENPTAITPPSPATPKPSSLNLYTLEFIAGLNLRSDDVEKRRQGRLEAALLKQISPPESHLVSRSLLELGILEMKEERFEEALSIFTDLAQSNAPPLARAYAKALAAKANFAIKEPTKASQLFLEAQEIARDVRETELSSLAALNAGITLLTTSRSKELDEITKNLDSPEARSFLILERGLFLSSKRDPAARDFLLSFLANFPNNPRISEASLALAESAVFTPPFDRELATRHITPLKFDLETSPILEARRILVLLALNTSTQQAEDFLNRSPNNPLADRVLFQLGQTYRDPGREEDKEIGKANLQFEILIDNHPESEFADIARFYSAVTSIALKTENEDKKAAKRFRELIAKKGVLANEAAINLCSLLIDRDEQENALIEITRFLESPELPQSDRRRLLLLGADAANQIGQHEKALTFYDDLLKIKALPVSTRNRANYIRGQALEKLGRTREALEAYYDVVNRNFDPGKATSLEWKWFDKCGIDGAIPLLEKEGRWEAAMTLAERLGRSGSPRAENARERAERIGLEHFIYRGRRPPARDEPESGQ